MLILKIIENTAKKSGGSVIAHTPKGMMASLPFGFKKLGFTVHDLLDEIADSIMVNRDFKQTQLQLSKVLNNCVACLKLFKVKIVSK